MNGLDVERVGLSFLILGMAERALELTIEYARSRQQFGRAIGEFQLVQAMVADMYAQLEALRSFTYHVGAEITALPHGASHRQVAKRAAAVVLQAGRTFTSIADKALQVHGGSGYIWETEINRLYRAGKLWEIGAGTTEMRQLQYEEDARRGEGKRSRTVLAPEYVSRYTEEVLDRVDLDPIVGFVGNNRAALLCVERDPEACHRSLIAARLERQFGAGVTHLKPASD